VWGEAVGGGGGGRLWGEAVGGACGSRAHAAIGPLIKRRIAPMAALLKGSDALNCSERALSVHEGPCPHPRPLPKGEGARQTHRREGGRVFFPLPKGEGARGASSLRGGALTQSSFHRAEDGPGFIPSPNGRGSKKPCRSEGVTPAARVPSHKCASTSAGLAIGAMGLGMPHCSPNVETPGRVKTRKYFFQDRRNSPLDSNRNHLKHKVTICPH
jgi:hypothetical protein